MNIRLLCSCFFACILLTASFLRAQPVDFPVNTGWEFTQQDSVKWRKASVPGNVHSDLLNHGLIPDPFYRLNEDSVRWVEDKNWVYRTQFTLPAAVLDKVKIMLRFEGLDTYASVYFNGVLLFTADNMFRPWEADVKSVAKQNNELKIVFESASGKMIPVRDALPYKLPSMNDKEKTCPLTRKAPYHYGWDWGPRIVTCGIWRPVHIIAYNEAEIITLHCETQEVSAKSARLVLSAEINSEIAGPATVTYQLASGASSVRGSAEIILKKGLASYVLPEFTLADPKLWYPVGYGAHPFYTVTAQLKIKEKLLDTHSVITGIRKVKLIQEPDSIGHSFYFEVNGIPVFAKGSNWIPADNLLNRVTPDIYDYLLQSAVDANMNMIRVWGGGIYEEDYFYKLCTEKGLMVWQDFMFGNEMYHVDSAFLASVKEEAIYNIKRLRNYPCVVLWCGDNEQEWGWIQWGWNKRYDARLMHGYRKINRELLPELVAELDSTRTYWRSSPTSNDEAPANDPNYGDMHFWDVHFGLPPYEKFLSVKPRFCSEFGQQAFPDWKTILQFTAPEDRTTAFDSLSEYGHVMESDVLVSHNKQPWGNKRIKDYMDYYYRVPESLYDYAYVSQLSQAEGIRTGVEHYRRSRPVTMGALYWQINDCYPVTSWSSIDYYGRWKALHYFARKFYAPVLVTTVEEKGNINTYIVSDDTENIPAVLTWTLKKIDGKTLNTSRKELIVTPLSSAVYVQAGLDSLSALPGFDSTDTYLETVLTTAAGKALSTGIFYFAKVKNLKLQPVTVAVKSEKTKFGLSTYTLTASTLAKNVYVWFDNVEGKFSDNYFDIVPGKPVTISFTPRHTGTKVKEKLKVRSLNEVR